VQGRTPQRDPNSLLAYLASIQQQDSVVTTVPQFDPVADVERINAINRANMERLMRPSEEIERINAINRMNRERTFRTSSGTP